MDRIFLKIIVITEVLLLTSWCRGQQEQPINKTFDRGLLEIDSVSRIQDFGDTIGFDTVLCGINFKPGKDYTKSKNEIKKIRSELSVKYLNNPDTIYKNKLLDSSMVVFTNYLLNKIIPYWYGTPWDFNGYTSIPNQGTIACGYFVSTTLRDMGLNINRYKLAQQGPENEAISIAINQTEVLYVSNDNISERLRGLKEGVYFIGLDYHVGYLYINNNNSYFIHSNYIDGEVMVEKTILSVAFKSSNYYIAKITGNETLIEKWLKGDEIHIKVK